MDSPNPQNPQVPQDPRLDWQQTESGLVLPSDMARLGDVDPSMLRALIGQSALSMPGVNEELDTSDPDTFRMLAEAAKRMFIGDSNVPASSKDRARISTSYETAEVGKAYPIPTMEAVKRAGIKPEGAGGAPLRRLERFVRKVGVIYFGNTENFTNQDERRAKANKLFMELMHNKESTGPDELIRALFARESPDRPGVWIDIHDPNKTYNAAQVAQARQQWFQDPSAFAAAFWYEIHKSAHELQFTETIKRTFELVNEAAKRRQYSFEGGPFTDRDIAGLILGIGYAHKGQHLSFRHLYYEINAKGEYEYRGVDAVKLIQEMAAKIRSYELSGFSAVDIANLTTIVETALETTIDKAEEPTSVEFIKSQFILQRAAMIISILRYGSNVNPEGDDAGALALRDKLGARGLLSMPPVRFNKETGQLFLDGQPLRTGGTALAEKNWEKVAAITDVACELFPNLKYIDQKELSILNASNYYFLEAERQKWIDTFGNLEGFDEQAALSRIRRENIKITKDSKASLSPANPEDRGKLKQLRRRQRSDARKVKRKRVRNNNEQLKAGRKQRKQQEWEQALIDARNRRREEYRRQQEQQQNNGDPDNA